MPLIKSASKKAREQNIEELLATTNRPVEQVLAIAYDNQRRAKARRASGGGKR